MNIRVLDVAFAAVLGSQVIAGKPNANNPIAVATKTTSSPVTLLQNALAQAQAGKFYDPAAPDQTALANVLAAGGNVLANVVDQAPILAIEAVGYGYARKHVPRSGATIGDVHVGA